MTDEEEERYTNAATYKLTGELRYHVVQADNKFIVYDSFIGNGVVWSGESRNIAEAVMQNMNGLDIDDA